MQRGKRTDSTGACFRNIYYPIKMGASECSNYLQPASGMMNGTDGFVQPQHTSISGALEVCAHPHSPSTLHLLTGSLLQSPGGCSAEWWPECLWVWGKYMHVCVCVCVCVFAFFRKILTFRFRRHFSLTDFSGAEVPIEVEMEAEDTVMLMGILFGCHWLKCFPQGCSIHGTNKKNI